MKHSSRICETGSQAKSWSKKSSSTDTGIDLGERGLPGSIWVFCPLKTWNQKRVDYSVLPALFLLVYPGHWHPSVNLDQWHTRHSGHTCSYLFMWYCVQPKCIRMPYRVFAQLSTSKGRETDLFMGPPEWTTAHRDWIIRCVSREPSNNHWYE